MSGDHGVDSPSRSPRLPMGYNVPSVGASPIIFSTQPEMQVRIARLICALVFHRGRVIL